jgi:hypothetical protein
LDKNSCLLAADVENLYPSIDLSDGLSALKCFLYNYKKTDSSVKISSFDIEFILDCAEFILKNNYLEFGDSIWKQIKGTAMGTPFAVTYACIYLHEIENKIFITMVKSSSYFNDLPMQYFRYIDDIFGIFKSYNAAIKFVKEFNKQKPNIIKLKITNIGNNVEVLDLYVEKTVDNKIVTKLYQKPQNMYLYFPPSSFHQPNVFRSFITAEIRRYFICCSNEIDFKLAIKNFKHRLLARGYDLDYLNKVMDVTTNFQRNKWLYISKNLYINSPNKCNDFYRNKSSIIFKTNYCLLKNQIN